METRRFDRRLQDTYRSLSLCLVCVLLTEICAPSTKADEQNSILTPSDSAFLHRQAAKLVNAARVNSGSHSGEYVNLTPDVLLLPDGQQAYHAFWIRDANMTLGADLVPAQDVRGWIDLTAATIANTDFHVRPGVIVPAYSVPDHINFDGKPTYFPGNYETGATQGGLIGLDNTGNLPPLDDPFFFLFTVCDYWRMDGNPGFFKSLVTSKTGTTRLCDLCQLVFDAVPVDQETDLVVVGNVETANAKDFGFCDGVSKSGKLLFTSVLRYDAALRLSVLYRAVGMDSFAEDLDHVAGNIRSHLASVFYHDSIPGTEGWLNSATGVGNQPDIWGSAYAVTIGAVDSKTATKITRSLLRGYRDHSLVKSGLVCQVLPHDQANPLGWQKCVAGPIGISQNGGYWGTGTGWYIAAICKADPNAARAMAKEFVGFLRANLRSDGTTQAWEWINPEQKKFINPLYVATVAFPYVTLCRAGLIK